MTTATVTQAVRQGEQLWAVLAEWGIPLIPSTEIEQHRGDVQLTSWIVNDSIDANGWVQLWGDGDDKLIDIREGDQLVVVETESVGLGDAIAGFTSAVGLRPCGGCKERQEWLNEAVPHLYRRRSK